MDAKLDPVRYSFKLLIASSTNWIYGLFLDPPPPEFPLTTFALEEDGVAGSFVVLSL